MRVGLWIRTFVYFVGVAVFLAAIGGAVYFYRQNTLLRSQSTTAVSPPKDDAAVVARVGQLMIVPQDEQPVISTVSEVEKLRSQPFFAKAENGDRILVYNSLKKAILYRPSANKIVEVGAVTVGTATASAQLQPKPTFAPKIALRNGTIRSDAVASFIGELKKQYPGANVLSVENAQRQDYKKSLIVDLTGKKAQETLDFAKALTLTVAQMPGGESTPSGELLIVVGSDR